MSNKYHNVRTEYNGVRYDSKAEAERAAELDLMLRAGEISGWTRQVRFDLGGVPYRVDFLVFEHPDKCNAACGVSHVWVEDVKGAETQRFRDVKRLWREYGPCDLRVIKRCGSRLAFAEVITPRSLSPGRERDRNARPR